jgi:hypothetical protein
MAIRIISPTYSFVQFGQSESIQGCCTEEELCALPVAEETDLYFQFSIVADNAEEIQAVNDITLSDIHLYGMSGEGNEGLPIFTNLVRNWTQEDELQFEKFITGALEITYLWRHPLYDVKTLFACNGCFQLGIYIEPFLVGATEYNFNAISNVFKHVCDSCYTAVIEYSNKKDYAGFRYCNIDDFVNRVRLPMYLTQPSHKEDKSVYRKSNGIIKQNSSLLYKEYLAITDFLTEKLHDKLSIALAHNDLLNLYDTKYQGGISKNGEYAIEWDAELNLCTAPANFKAIAYGFTFKNANCTDCNTAVLPERPVCIIGIATTAFSYENTETDLIYTAVFLLDVQPESTVIDYSLDLGITWYPIISFGPTSGLTLTANYSIPPNVSDTVPHYIRVRTVCANGASATAHLYYYSEDYSLTFVATSITSTSFQLNSGFSSGVSFDISLDGGATYILTGLTSTSYIVTGLTTGTTYQVVRRMHSLNGIVQALPPVNVTTL